MSRPAARRQAAALKRLPMDAPEDDDTDESEWDDVSGHALGAHVPKCNFCDGDGMDPLCDRLLPCPECQGEQRP